MVTSVGASWKVIAVLLLVVGCSFSIPAGERLIQPVVGDNMLCPEPNCVTQKEIETLWGYPDANFFLQCRPLFGRVWSLQLMPCAPSTWFSFRHQVCVSPQFWEGCTGTEGTTSGTTGPEPTTDATDPTPDITPTPEPTTDPDITDTTVPSTPSTEFGTDDILNPCGGPRCESYEEINTLWIHPSTTYFYQCKPLMGIWSPQEMPCAPGTLFSFDHQVCVFEEYWVNTCENFTPIP